MKTVLFFARTLSTFCGFSQDVDSAAVAKQVDSLTRIAHTLSRQGNNEGSWKPLLLPKN
ncbi:MAG: hypothetical protein ACKVU2_15805 [Saprospiraceae bacterium]